MNNKVEKALKVIVPIVSIGATLTANFLSKKELDEKVSAKVAEALANTTKEEA